MKQALHNLTEKQLKFICDECVVDMTELMGMNEEKVYDIVYETMCNIEVAEVCANIDGDDSERCAMASDIVTILGNAMAKAEGLMDEYEQGRVHICSQCKWWNGIKYRES